MPFLQKRLPSSSTFRTSGTFTQTQSLTCVLARHTRKEAGMLHSLAHPRIVQLMGLVLSPSRCAIVMDYAPRTRSLQWLRRAGEIRW